ncbi:MAG: hypothetical protein IJ231_00540 [Clostridia bacterium]|nr:hypothetical protein [Clostridia bacterium]
MRELSIFVDESGDFGVYEKHAPSSARNLLINERFALPRQPALAAAILSAEEDRKSRKKLT